MLGRSMALLRFAIGLFVCVLYAPTAQSSFILAAPVSLPGWNPSYNGGVLLYDFSGTGPLQPLPTIPGQPQTLLNDPSSAAFDASGELFISNRHGNVGNGVGSIARFGIDALGGYVPHGSITGNGLDAVHGLAFGSTDELFAANFRSDTISRFNSTRAVQQSPMASSPSTVPITCWVWRFRQRANCSPWTTRR